MNYAANFLIVAAAASLLACSQSEDTPAPATEPPAVEAPQAVTAPEPVAPAVETPQAETAPVSALPEASQSPPAAAGKPAAAKSVALPVVPAPATAEAAPGAPAPDLAHGQQIYRQACAFCHDKGVAGAPKTGDVAAWGPRLAQGMDTLYTVALRGKGAMPARGGNPSLADAEVKAAVDYLVAQSR